MTTITNPDTDGDGGLDATGADAAEDRNENGASENEATENEAADPAGETDGDVPEAEAESDEAEQAGGNDVAAEGDDNDDPEVAADEHDPDDDPEVAADEHDPDDDPNDEGEPLAIDDDDADDEDGSPADEDPDERDEAIASEDSDDDGNEEATDDGAEAVEDDRDPEADGEADPSDEVETAPEDDTDDRSDDQLEDQAEADDPNDGEAQAVLTEPDTGPDRATETVAGAEGPSGARAGVELLPADALGSEWSLQQLVAILAKSLIVVLAVALAGFGLGASRGEVHIARSEFVYSLTDSVPDSFLREDRRLLTQVATFTSDAVVIPVADRFNLDPDQLRDKMVIETVELSEVLRLEVTDPDPGRALGINRALVEGYLQVLSEATPIDDGRDLTERRDEILAALEAADQRQLDLDQAAEQDAVLAVEQDSIQRRVDLTRDRVDGLQGRLDDALTDALVQSGREEVEAELVTAEAELAQLEDQLGELAAERADLATATTARPDLTREVFRLEGQLATVEAELTERELGPLLTSSILELSDPVVIERSATEAGLQGAAVGALLSLPIAAWLAYRSRRSQLWSA